MQLRITIWYWWIIFINIIRWTRLQSYNHHMILMYIIDFILPYTWWFFNYRVIEVQYLQPPSQIYHENDHKCYSSSSIVFIWIYFYVIQLKNWLTIYSINQNLKTTSSHKKILTCKSSDRQTTSFIENITESGILLRGNWIIGYDSFTMVWALIMPRWVRP